MSSYVEMALVCYSSMMSKLLELPYEFIICLNLLAPSERMIKDQSQRGDCFNCDCTPVL